MSLSCYCAIVLLCCCVIVLLCYCAIVSLYQQQLEMSRPNNPGHVVAAQAFVQLIREQDASVADVLGTGKWTNWALVHGSIVNIPGVTINNKEVLDGKSGAGKDKAKVQMFATAEVLGITDVNPDTRFGANWNLVGSRADDSWVTKSPPWCWRAKGSRDSYSVSDLID